STGGGGGSGPAGSAQPAGPGKSGNLAEGKRNSPRKVRVMSGSRALPKPPHTGHPPGGEGRPPVNRRSRRAEPPFTTPPDGEPSVPFRPIRSRDELADGIRTFRTG